MLLYVDHTKTIWAFLKEHCPDIANGMKLFLFIYGADRARAVSIR
jgi:hypothetical protein